MAAQTTVRALILLALAACAGGHVAAAAATHDASERLYREGILPSGAALRGEREPGPGVEGADITGPAAACVNCHKRSGLGAGEGRIVVPPIVGKYLFRTSARNLADLDLPHVEGASATRPPYTRATLARAIRQGVGSDGHRLSYLMPHYRLDDATMAALIEYLNGLAITPVPGVTDDVLHFATIITPGADPQARTGMLAVLERFFATKNAGFRGDAPPMRTEREIMYRVNRKWQLHVWELSGTPETWDQQLRSDLRNQPVFAVVSGLGSSTWAPIHRFCETSSLPCVLPNVDLPVVAERDFYSIYFSRGLYLEADLLSAALRAQHAQQATAPRRLVQLMRGEDSVSAAAESVESTARELGLQVLTRQIAAGPAPQALAEALTGVGEGDVLMMWLGGPDLAALPAAGPNGAIVYLSGLRGGLESAPLPAVWHSVAHMTYPVDLPDARRVRMNFPLGWMRVQQIPVVAERVQADTYLACQILSEALGHMLDSFVPDFLIERIELMVSQRLVSGLYPRLGLAPGQRFASKGGYLVHFLDPSGPRVTADGDWVVP